MNNDIERAMKAIGRLIIFVAAWSASWVVAGAFVRFTADLFCIGYRC